MNRRQFIYYYGTFPIIGSGIVAPLSVLSGYEESVSDFSALIMKLISVNDAGIPGAMKNQNVEKYSICYGGVRDQFGIYNAGSTAGLITRLTCSFVSRESGYYLSADLLEAMKKATGYLLKIQHEDGSIDLLTTNFRSTPDTGFVVEPLSASYTLLSGMEFEGKDELLSLIEKFLKNAGEALIKGGIHTPNHRWVVSMALARLNFLFPDERYVNRIDQWLNEGIDMDADGQYTEHSTLIYTPLSNRCLITVARLLNRPELYEPVRKNLQMTLFYMHPNGEVATEGSGRQDQYMAGTMEGYHLSYRYLAIQDQNPVFSAMARLLERSVPEKLSGFLVYYLENPFYFRLLPDEGKLPENYFRKFPHSGIVRIRRGNSDATILAKNPTFFTFTKGGAVLASVRMASAFFGKGQFQSTEIINTNSTSVLRWEYTWGYFQPFPDNEKPDSRVSFDEDRKKRGMSEVQQLQAKVVISEKEGVFTLEFVVEGTDNVPLAIELGFRNGGQLAGVIENETEKGSFLLKEGTGIYSFNNDSIEFGPGEASHCWTRIRGGLPRPDALCVYLTGFTPYHRVITFR